MTPASRRRAADVSVLVIGAGMAGLACARRLREYGHLVTVLEARASVGGRVRTLDGLVDHPIELGGTWICPRDPGLTELVDPRWARGQIPDPWQSCVVVPGARGRLVRLSDDEEAALSRGLHRLLDRLGDEAPSSRRTVAQALDLERRPWMMQRRILSEFVADAAATPEEVGAYAFGIQAEGAPPRVIARRGAVRIAEALAEGLDVVLGAVASRVIHGPRGAIVELADGRRFAAQHVVVTAPLGVLQLPPGERGAITFDPPLCADKLAAIAGLKLGTFNKLVLRFRRRFWGEGWSFLEILEGPPLGPVVIVDASFGRRADELGGGAALILELIGAQGRALTPAADDREAQVELVRAVLTRLERIFGARRVRAATGAGLPTWHLQDWSREPFARGCYTVVPAGGLQHIQALRAPESRSLHFAGEAIGVRVDGELHIATISAAVASGLEVAARIHRTRREHDEQRDH